MRQRSGHHSRRRRVVPLLWAGCATAAILLTLSVNGTLADWTQAIITNDADTAGTGPSVILRETGPDGTAGHVAQTCFSSDVASNSSTCSTINKYGGTSTPLTPGTSQFADVTFTNVGSAPATSFVLAPGTCTQAPTAGSGTPPAANVCTNGDLTVTMSCEDGSVYNPGDTHWTGFAYSGAPAGWAASYTRTGTRAPGASVTCRFTVELSAGAGVSDSAVQVSQELQWTLSA